VRYLPDGAPHQELQEGLKRPQEPVKKAQNPPESSQQLPKTPTRFFRSTWYGSRCGKNGKNNLQELSAVCQDVHQVFPKHLIRQPFSEKSKNQNHSSKEHRRNLRSPVSMNPKGLASNRRMKKAGGRGDPPWGSQSVARPVGVEPSVLDRQQDL
jgi:hypothetical protein